MSRDRVESLRGGVRVVVVVVDLSLDFGNARPVAIKR